GPRHCGRSALPGGAARPRGEAGPDVGRPQHAALRSTPPRGPREARGPRGVGEGEPGCGGEIRPLLPAARPLPRLRRVLPRRPTPRSRLPRGPREACGLRGVGQGDPGGGGEIRPLLPAARPLPRLRRVLPRRLTPRSRLPRGPREARGLRGVGQGDPGGGGEEHSRMASPLILIGAGGALGVLALAIRRPALACALLALAIPLSAGMARGAVVPVLRVNEALLMIVAVGFLVHRL